MHSKLKPYHCNYCSKDFTRNDHLRRHQQRVHGEETQAAATMTAAATNFEQRFICQECKAIFTSSGHLRVHMENKHHHDYTDFIARDPNKTVVQHDTTYVIVDGKKRPVCQLCNKSFSKKDHLTRHINNIHTGHKHAPVTTAAAFTAAATESSFNCHLCGKRFSRSEFLRRHLEDAHNSSAQMDIINQLNPNNPYNNNSSSQVSGNPMGGGGADPLFALQPPHHMMYDSYDLKPVVPKPVKPQSQKTHNCNICSKNFSRRYHLTRHQKNLHPEIVNSSGNEPSSIQQQQHHQQQQQPPPPPLQQQQHQVKKPSIWSPEDMIRAQSSLVEQASRGIIDIKYQHHHHPYPQIPSYNHHSVVDAFTHSLKPKKETNSQ